MVQNNPDTKKDKLPVYQDLARKRKECKECRDPEDCTKSLYNASMIDDGKWDCDEIGAWSQWQGNLNADLMVVAQDFGNIRWFLDAEGYPTGGRTNRVIAELLKAAGFNIELPRKGSGRGSLFFTNAVLCMKQGKAQDTVKPEWFRNCARKFLQPLVNVVQPKAVVCIGKKAYCGVMGLKGIGSSDFPKVVQREEPRLLGGISVFAVYHCGTMVTNTIRSLDKQMADWRRIGDYLRRESRCQSS